MGPPHAALPPQAEAWLDACLAAAGRRRVGTPDLVHARMWSRVWRVAATGGPVWFKVPGPPFAHEAPLTQALADWSAGCVPAVLGADVERRWLLLDDAGETLRARTPSAEGLDAWAPILNRFARLQIDMIPRAVEIEAMGIPDRRITGLAGQIEGLLDDEDALMLGEPEGMPAEDRAALRRGLPRLEHAVSRLAALGIPETLHHEDFHDANIFVCGGNACFTDWGEAGISHPFSTLLVCLRAVADRIRLREDHPALERLRGAYLEPWLRFAPLPALRDALALARLTGMACRALSWHRALAPFGRAASADDRSAVPGWLLALRAALG